MIGQETVNKFNTGGSHSVNPYRGIPINGQDRVEEGETSVDFDEGKYIFSTKLFINNIDDEFPMELPDDLTFAEASSYIGNQFREGGMIDDDTQMEILIALRTAQEIERRKRGVDNNTNEFRTGGNVDQVQNRMQIADGVSQGLMAAGAFPTPASPFLIGAGLAVKVGTQIFGGNKIKDLEQQTADDAENLAKQESATSPFSSKVFPYGGYVQDPPQDSTTNAYRDTTLNKQMLPPIYDTINPLPIDTNKIQLPTLPQGVNELPFGGSSRQSLAQPASQSINQVQLNNPLLNQGLKTGNADYQTVYEGVSNTTGNEKSFLGNLQDNIGTEGMIGLGTQLATGLTSNIVGLASTQRSAPVPRYDIAQERQANLLYTDETRRDINRNTQTQVQALANRSAGNIGAFASNVAAIGNAGSTALGQSYIQQQQLNNREQLETDQFNFRQRAIQARNDRQADDLDAANEGAYINQRNAYRDALFANVASFGETLNTIGQGDVYLDALGDNAKITAALKLQMRDLELEIANLKR